MDRTVRERLARVRELAARVEEEAGCGKWDTALARAVTLDKDAAFIVDWLRGQAECHFSTIPAAEADGWEPTSEPPLGNVTEPLSGTLDADMPLARE